MNKAAFPTLEGAEAEQQPETKAAKGGPIGQVSAQAKGKQDGREREARPMKERAENLNSKKVFEKMAEQEDEKPVEIVPKKYNFAGFKKMMSQ